MSAFPLPVFDRFTTRQMGLIDGFLDNMSDRTTCESHIAAAEHGFHFQPCEMPAVVSDIACKYQFCRDCHPKYLRGDWL